MPADRVHGLYGLPLDDFTHARDALAAELRKGKRREEAAWVKGLRKPTVAAWIVNQLARGEEEKTAALVRAGERLREVQERLGTGEAGADDLREATDAERNAVSELVDRAGEQAGDTQPSEATLERVRETLHAAALDDATRRAVEAGCVTREGSAVGLGFLSGAEAAPPKRRQRRGRDGGGSRGDATKQRREQREEERRAAEEELSRLEGRVREEKEALADARTAARDTRRERDRAQRRLDEKTSRVEDGEARLERAEREVKEARDRLAKLRRSGKR